VQRPFRVLFVCFGNAIRSQMAEHFALTYGKDVLVARSAGVAPATSVAVFTRKVMLEKNIDIGDAYPKAISDHGGEPFDLVVNMSGIPLAPELRAPVREWQIRDPIGSKEAVYRDTAELIERKVMDLILELRGLRKKWDEEFGAPNPKHPGTG